MKVKGLRKRGEIYWFRHMVDGQRLEVSLKTSDMEEAISAALKLREAGPKKNDPRISILRERWIADKLATDRFRDGRTPSAARSTLRMLEQFTGDVQISQITEQKLQDWKKDLLARLSKSTVSGYFSRVHSFFSWCKAKNVIAINNAKKVTRPVLGESDSRQTFCTKATRDRLIANAPDESMRVILWLGFHGGLRMNEIIEARRDWVDLENGRLMVRRAMKNTRRLRPGERQFQPKNRNERSIPMSEPLKAFLTAHMAKPELNAQGEPYDSPLDFLYRPDKKQGEGDYRIPINDRLRPYFDSQKCPEVSAHVMRHTFASLLVQNGTSIFKVAKWIGDSIKITIQHYAHLEKADDDINRMV